MLERHNRHYTSFPSAIELLNLEEDQPVELFHPLHDFHDIFEIGLQKPTITTEHDII